jgi:hypothetical protein
VSRACEAWIKNHAGKTMAIYDCPGIINMSRNFTATPSNIEAGHLDTGIFPYNRDIFVDEEFLFSYVRQTSSSHRHCSIDLQQRKH